MAKLVPLSDGDTPPPPPPPPANVVMIVPAQPPTPAPPVASDENRPSLTGDEELTKYHGARRDASIQLTHAMQAALQQTSWYDSPLAVATRSVIRSRAFTTIGMITLFIALFIPDLFVAVQVPTNIELDIILIFALLIFAVEWIGLSGTDASYLFSFFFWMDALGTVSILLDMSFFPLGPDATEPEKVDSGAGVSDHAIIVRAARAAKLGARAGRLSRVLKLLRFLPFLNLSDKEEDNVKVAKVISNQLTNMLSTRVSFLTICVALVLPVFTLFTYPEVDESMSTWTRLLARTAQKYCSTQDASTRNATIGKLNSELKRFSKFYEHLNYGPFAVCCGTMVGDDFQCNSDQFYRHLDQSIFTTPDRKASIQLVSHEHFQTFFDLSTPRQFEALASTATICFIIIVMCSFSLLISSNMTVVVLNPLERMLAVVRGHCMQIFKYSEDLKEDDSDDSDDGEDFDEVEQSNEFAILEKVIAKLSAVASLFTKEEPAAGDDLDDDQLMTLEWMQGVQARSARRNQSKRISGMRQSSGGVVVVEADLAASGVPRERIEKLDTWLFNTQGLTSKESIALATYVVLNHPRCTWTHTHVAEDKVLKYVTQIESKYIANAFHNFSHATDVMYTLSRFLQLNKAETFVQERTPFWLQIACIAHDAGHIGVNNQFLIETSHELALKYNDRSPLENLHCATLFQVSTEPEANIFALMEKDEYKELRHCLIDAILHTDMTKHMEMIKEINMLYELNSDAFDAPNPDGLPLSYEACEVLLEPKHTQLVANAMLHAADINNPMKPWDLAQVLAYLCIDEFFAQGDMELAAGIPVSMLNDRQKVNKPNSQVGFIEFVIAPMVIPLCSLFPQLSPMAENLAKNVGNWSQKWVQEANPAPEAVVKVEARVAKLADKLNGVVSKNAFRLGSD